MYVCVLSCRPHPPRSLPRPWELVIVARGELIKHCSQTRGYTNELTTDSLSALGRPAGKQRVLQRRGVRLTVFCLLPPSEADNSETYTTRMLPRAATKMVVKLEGNIFFPRFSSSFLPVFLFDKVSDFKIVF